MLKLLFGAGVIPGLFESQTQQVRHRQNLIVEGGLRLGGLRLMPWSHHFKQVLCTYQKIDCLIKTMAIILRAPDLSECERDSRIDWHGPRSQ